jgi:hypothetical protein
MTFSNEELIIISNVFVEMFLLTGLSEEEESLMNKIHDLLPPQDKILQH